MKIELTQDEIDRCMYWGSAVHSKKNGYSSTKLFDRTKNSHGIGKIGELAFAKLSPVLSEENIDWNIQETGDNFDFSIGTKTIDVKTTTYYQYPKLKENFPAPKKLPQYYVLCGLNFNKRIVKVHGYISAKEFIVDSFISNPPWANHRQIYIASPGNLNPNFELLWEV